MKKLKFSPMMIMIFVMVITLLSLSITLAKYVFTDESNNVIKPENFIFVTNYDDKETYEVYGSSFSFNVSNEYLSVKNSTDIKYSITVIKTSDSSVVSNNVYEIKKDETSKPHTLSGLNAVGETYEIVIQSTDPIKKTITHYVKIEALDPITSSYKVTDEGTYIVVDIYIGTDFTGILTVNYSETLIADNLNPLMKGWTTTSETISNLVSNSHYELVFFKTNADVFTKAETKLDGNTIAINKIS